jgi:putative glutamine amidotransferase
MDSRVIERPLIGVTTSEVRMAEHVDPLPQAEPATPEMALGMKYLRSVELAGGLPVVLPPLELDAVDPLLDRLAGVCLSGGPDLHPRNYGGAEHPELGPTQPDLDRFELSVARYADIRGMPILAICRGAQTLNVARGGTLEQHLPERGGSSIAHRQRKRGDLPTHTVRIAPGSRLAGAMGCHRAEVNSFHHQAVAEIGRGLRAVAWAPDGVVEAIEAPRRDLVLGVQWHAEGLNARAEHAALFEALVSAAVRFDRAGVSRAA